MKKIVLFLSLFISIILCSEVKACGEITSLSTDVGTVEQVNSTNYIVSVPEGTNKVFLNASTEYDWVSGYGPREVSTNSKVELQVDGNKCGYGIYTYFITFKHLVLIAENNENQEPTQETNNQESSLESENETTEENDNTTNETTQEENLIKLSDITIENYDIDFEPNITEYNLVVEENVKKLNITAIAENESYTVNISDESNDLQIGTNKILITVTNQEGQTSTYTLIVNREKKLSSNNYLASITINGYMLNFDSSQTNYVLTIGKEKFLNINVVTENKSATYEILGNSDLKNDSVITIRVTAEDGSIKDYVITIKKNFNIQDYIIYIVLVLLVVLLIVLLILRKKRKKKKENAPEEIQNNIETAGLKKEILPENIQTSDQSNNIANTITSSEDIEFIEPTNINENQNSTSTSVKEETEVFKL